MLPTIHCRLKDIVMCGTPFYRTSNKLKLHFLYIEHVHWWTIELQHPIFGLERKDIKPNRHITRFTKLLIEKTPISFFRTSNEFKRDLLLVIKLKQLRTQFAQSLERWKVVIFLVMDRTPSHWTLNGLEHVFIFRNRTWQLYFWMNIEQRTLYDPCTFQ